MHLRLVPVVRLLIGLTGSKMKGTGDFFVEQDIEHRFAYDGIESDRKFPDKTGSFVGIENFIQLSLPRLKKRLPR